RGQLLDEVQAESAELSFFGRCFGVDGCRDARVEWSAMIGYFSGDVVVVHVDDDGRLGAIVATMGGELGQNFINYQPDMMHGTGVNARFLEKIGDFARQLSDCGCGGHNAGCELVHGGTSWMSSADMPSRLSARVNRSRLSASASTAQAL